MRLFVSLLLICALISCKNNTETPTIDEVPVDNTISETVKTAQDTLIYPEEKHFKSIRQVTFGGDNAEAYWSFDDSQIVFQSNFKDWVWNATKCS